MDFAVPSDVSQLLEDLDEFTADAVKPIEDADDNIRFFDHRREDSGTDWDRDGLPNANGGLRHATHDYVSTRTSGNPAEGFGITCFVVPVDAAGFSIEDSTWSFNMPTDHTHVPLTDARVRADIVEAIQLPPAEMHTDAEIRIAEGSEEIQLHKVAGKLFGYTGRATG